MRTAPLLRRDMSGTTAYVTLWLVVGLAGSFLATGDTLEASAVGNDVADNLLGVLKLESGFIAHLVFFANLALVVGVTFTIFKSVQDQTIHGKNVALEEDMNENKECRGSEQGGSFNKASREQDEAIFKQDVGHPASSTTKSPAASLETQEVVKPGVLTEEYHPELAAHDAKYFVAGMKGFCVCPKEMSIDWFKFQGGYIQLQPSLSSHAGGPSQERVKPQNTLGRLSVVVELEGTLLMSWKEGEHDTIEYSDLPAPHKFNVRNRRIEAFRVNGHVGVIRPGAREFLHRLLEFADLYVYTLAFNRNVAREIMDVLAGDVSNMFKGLETRAMGTKNMKDLMVLGTNMNRTVLVDHKKKVRQPNHLIEVDEFTGSPMDWQLIDKVYPAIEEEHQVESFHVEPIRAR